MLYHSIKIIYYYPLFNIYYLLLSIYSKVVLIFKIIILKIIYYRLLKIIYYLLLYIYSKVVLIFKLSKEVFFLFKKEQYTRRYALRKLMQTQLKFLKILLINFYTFLYFREIFDGIKTTRFNSV